MLPPVPPLVCVRPPLLALLLTPPLLWVLPPLRPLLVPPEPPVVPALWLPPRLPPEPPELVADEPPLVLLGSLLDEPPEAPALE